MQNFYCQCLAKIGFLFEKVRFFAPLSFYERKKKSEKKRRLFPKKTFGESGQGVCGEEESGVGQSSIWYSYW